MINYYWISIKGKNSKYFLYNVLKNKISVLDVRYYKDEILLKMSYNEYKKILKINTSCTISIFKTVGIRKMEQLYQKYKLTLVIFAISVFFIIFMSKFILFINVESNNNFISNTIKKELVNYNITPFTLKKRYNSLKKISTDIKNNNLDKIEWIELEQKGVFLNVRVIPRIKNNTSLDNGYRDIVASQSGYIRKIESNMGQVLKNTDDYVKKGEIIVSGNIYRNDKVVGKVRADGTVYAEVWYIAKTNQSLSYLKTAGSEKGRMGISIFIQNKEIKLLYFPIKINVSKTSVLFKNSSFSIVLKKEKKYVKIKSIYNSYDLQKILELRTRNSVLKSLKNDEYIISQKTLKKYVKNGKMYIEVFFKCYQDIAESKALQEIKEKKDGLND